MQLLFISNIDAQRLLADINIHPSIPYVKGGKLQQEIYYKTDSLYKVVISIAAYRYNTIEDSILLYKKVEKVNLKKGIKGIKINYNEGVGAFYNQQYYQIIKRSGNVPAGEYKVCVSIQKDTAVFTKTFLQDIDSNINAGSPVREDIDQTLVPRKAAKGKLKSSISIQTSNKKLVDRSKNKLGRALRSKGMTQVISQKDGKEYINLYYEDWFVGRYVVENDQALSDQIEQRKNKLNKNPGSFATNELDNYQPVFSQIKTLKRDKKDNDELIAELSYLGNFSNGQEENSSVDNNYSEFRARVEAPIYDMPVSIEGFYTAQDARRLAKASYIRLHYDVDKAKDGLMRTIKGYNEKYAQTKSRGMGLTSVYKSYLNTLQGERGQILSELSKSAQVDVKVNKDGLDDTAAFRKAANDRTQKLAEKKKRLEDVDRKIKKYQTLIDQYQNTNFFDSAMAYDKTKDIDPSKMSYREITKRADALFPEGKSKSFIAGITHLDAGMFPKYQSKYTMGGQMVKGVDVGYDWGPVQTGFTVGRTEYIGRDGSMDQYTCYSGEAMFKPYENGQMSLVYYGYMPSRQMLSGESFFKDVDIAMPSFTKPVHIVGITYAGAITKYIMANAEVARSFKQNDTTTDNMAYHFEAEGNIPRTNICLLGSYEKAGKGFENNSLPMLPSGTEQYKIAGKSDFFRSFLTVGIEFNQMLQSNFASKGSNTRWGFDVATHSRQYPSVSLSYKPFSTFRSYTDTLNVPQRPLFGSVWAGKASYQIKRVERSYQFMIIYNRSISEMDTAAYGSSLLQLTGMYLVQSLNTSLSIGNMHLWGDNVALTTTPNNTWFANITAGYMLNSRLQVNAGQETGWSNFGFCKYALTAGGTYHFEAFPLISRINLRCNTYKLNPLVTWKQLYGGSIELTWLFKTKIRK